MSNPKDSERHRVDWLGDEPAYTYYPTKADAVAGVRRNSPARPRIDAEGDAWCGGVKVARIRHRPSNSGKSGKHRPGTQLMLTLEPDDRKALDELAGHAAIPSAVWASRVLTQAIARERKKLLILHP